MKKIKKRVKQKINKTKIREQKRSAQIKLDLAKMDEEVKEKKAKGISSAIPTVIDEKGEVVSDFSYWKNDPLLAGEVEETRIMLVKKGLLKEDV